VPGTFANDAEVMVIAQALKRAGKGGFQIIPSSTLGPGREGFREHASLEQEIDLIANVYPQVGSRPTGLVFGMQTYHLWMLKPTFRKLRGLPDGDLLAELRKPEVKQTILMEANEIDGVPLGSMEFHISQIEPTFDNLFPLRSDSTYEPLQDESIASLAAEANLSPESVLYDYLVAERGRMAILFFTNYSEFNLDAVREMQLDSETVTGLSDAGAHVR